jgi:hypothetical protein
MMDDLLEECKDVCDVYMDDLIVGSRMIDGEDLLDTHDRDVRKVLNALKKWDLIADIKKCKFFLPEVEFCSHILGGGVRRPGPGTLCAIENGKSPKQFLICVRTWDSPTIMPFILRITPILLAGSKKN